MRNIFYVYQEILLNGGSTSFKFGSFDVDEEREKEEIFYRGTSPIRECLPLEPHRRPMPRVLGGSQGVGRFLIGEVSLCDLSGEPAQDPAHLSLSLSLFLAVSCDLACMSRGSQLSGRTHDLFALCTRTPLRTDELVGCNLA